MANKLHEDLTDRYVVVGVEGMKSEFHAIEWRVWHCLGGFGCRTYTAGRTVAAECVADGEQADIRDIIERFATDDEIAAARKLRGDINEGKVDAP